MRRTAIALFCLLTAPAFAQGAGNRIPSGPAREVVIANRAAQAVREIYASPSNTDDWGEDRLGAELLPPGKVFRVRLGRTRECNWDLQVVYANGATEENRKINICRIRLVSFDGSAAVVVDRGPTRTLAVQNASSDRIDQFYVSPADSDRWFDDRLQEPIRPGERGSVEFRGGCEVDIRVVFASRAAEERRGIDACKLERLVVAPGWTLRADPSALPVPVPSLASLAASSPNRITVRNDSARTIVELYLFPDGATHGEDRLGMSVLDPGQERRIAVASDKGCTQTLHIVLAGPGPDLERAGIDVCREGDLTVTSAGIQAGRPTSPEATAPH